MLELKEEVKEAESPVLELAEEATGVSFFLRVLCQHFAKRNLKQEVPIQSEKTVGDQLSKYKRHTYSFFIQVGDKVMCLDCSKEFENKADMLKHQKRIHKARSI